MQQFQTFVDNRLAAYCGQCHALSSTRDHVPAKVFLDEPYPDNLPVVWTCEPCNRGASLDEEYVACLLEVAACGTDDPSRLERPKIARTLSHKSALRARLARAFCHRDDGALVIAAEEGRLRRVLEKTARGLWTFETGDTTGDYVATVEFAAIADVDEEAMLRFRDVSSPQLLPEVGSRMMFRVLVHRGTAFTENAWQEVDPDRFEYAVEVLGHGGRVKMVIRNYLIAQVVLTA